MHLQTSHVCVIADDNGVSRCFKNYSRSVCALYLFCKQNSAMSFVDVPCLTGAFTLLEHKRQRRAKSHHVTSNGFVHKIIGISS